MHDGSFTPPAVATVTPDLAAGRFGQRWAGAILDGRGQTLGQMAMGVRVISIAGGAPIGYRRAFIRAVVALILNVSVVGLLGYLWMLWDRSGQTWYDKLAGALVVCSR